MQETHLTKFYIGPVIGFKLSTLSQLTNMLLILRRHMAHGRLLVCLPNQRIILTCEVKTDAIAYVLIGLNVINIISHVGSGQ